MLLPFRAKEDANERVSQSLSKVEKAESEKAMEEENSGNSPVVDTDPRFDKDKKVNILWLFFNAWSC